MHTRRLALYSHSASGTDCYFCILSFCNIVYRTSRPLALAYRTQGLTTPFVLQIYKKLREKQIFLRVNYLRPPPFGVETGFGNLSPKKFFAKKLLGRGS